MLAGDDAVGAGAGRRGGEGDLVDVAGGAEDEKVGARAVKEAERVAERSKDALADEGQGEGMRRRRRRGGVGSDGLHGQGIDPLGRAFCWVSRCVE